MNQVVIDKVKEALITASSGFREDQKEAYRRAIEQEGHLQSCWVLKTLLENALVAQSRKSPLCDDTGIPHLFLEIGKNNVLTGDLLENIKEGVREGLKCLPGRPMAIKGNTCERLDQSGGLDDDPQALQPAPVLIKSIDEDILRLHVLMLGGGPAIRGKTYRVFHRHNVNVVIDEIVAWSKDAVAQLGCTPCTLAVGIGRTQFEATSMMIESMVYGNYGVQSELENEITRKVNESNVGALGLGGNVSVLATFLNVGPQRASGVRIVCLRPCCCVEPRRACVIL